MFEIISYLWSIIHNVINKSEAWGEKRAPALPKTGNCFALLACMHARTHAHSELTGRASQKTPRSVPFQLSRVLSVFLDLLVDTLCFLTNVSRISLSWPIWKAGVAIRTRLHEEFECLCCLCQLNCYFARVFDGFWSCQLSWSGFARIFSSVFNVCSYRLLSDCILHVFSRVVLPVHHLNIQNSHFTRVLS